MQKTPVLKQADIDRSWHHMDASDQVLGRFASEVAKMLIGKHKPVFTPHVDAGDYVVVTNAEKIAVTGNKLQKKHYYSHSNYPGGFKAVSLERMMSEFPERVIEKAVYNMLPKNKLRTGRMNRLKVYAGGDHPHASQFTAQAGK